MAIIFYSRCEYKKSLFFNCRATKLDSFIYFLTPINFELGKKNCSVLQYTHYLNELS